MSIKDHYVEKMAGEGELPTLARRVLAIQEERILVYGSFDRAHRDYLSTYPQFDFEGFKKIVNEITQKFNALSKEVISISGVFKKEGHVNISSVLEAIQEKEREKLQQTAEWQLVAKQCVEFPDNEEFAESKRKLKSVLSQMDGTIADLVQDFRYECEDLLQ